MDKVVIDLTIDSEEKYERKTIPKPLKQKMWETYVGKNYDSHCFAGCGRTIDVFNFECGHILSIKNGGTNTIANLKPVCSLCNKSMGTQNLVEFGKKYFDYHPMDLDL